MADYGAGIGAGTQSLAQGLMMGMQMGNAAEARKLQERSMALGTVGMLFNVSKLPKTMRGPILDQLAAQVNESGVGKIHPVVIDAMKKAGDDEFNELVTGLGGWVRGDKGVDAVKLLGLTNSVEGGAELFATAFKIRSQQQQQEALNGLLGENQPQPAAGVLPTAAEAPPSFTPDQIQAIKAVGAISPAKAAEMVAEFRLKQNDKNPINMMMPDGTVRSFLPGTPDLVKAIRAGAKVERAPAAVVNMNTNMETEYGKEAGKGIAKIHNERIEGGQKADSRIAIIDTMQPLLEAWQTAGGDQGALASLQASGSSILQSLRIDPTQFGLPADAGPAQTIEAMQKRLAVEMIGPGGLPANNFSEADRKFVEQMQGALTDTATGFQGKLFVARKLAERSRAAADFVLEQQSEGKNGQQIEAGWRQFVKANPVFTGDDRKYLAGLTVSKGNAPADILKMTIDELGALDPTRMSPAQLQAAKRRYDALSK